MAGTPTRTLGGVEFGRGALPDGLVGGEGETAASAVAGEVDFGGPSSAASAEGVIVRSILSLLPPFRPVSAACWWARTMVESVWTSQSMSPAASAWAWICCKEPRRGFRAVLGPMPDCPVPAGLDGDRDSSAPAPAHQPSLDRLGASGPGPCRCCRTTVRSRSTEERRAPAEWRWWSRAHRQGWAASARGSLCPADR